MATAPYIHEDFLLQNPAAVELYHRYAKGQPVVDYHCHVSARMLVENACFANLTEAWLAGDHYKWRVMRADGVAEELITGAGGDREKFQAFAAAMPRLLRNPVYHWAHMELADPFGLRDRLLNGHTAESIWREGNARLATAEFAPRALLRHFGVEVLCTTDDPADSLEDHRLLAADASFPVAVLPTFRPDKALAIENTASWNAYLDRLGATAGVEIRGWEDLLAALEIRAREFAKAGCRLADCGIAEPYADDFSPSHLEATVQAARGGYEPDAGAARSFRSALIYELGRLYNKLGWASQFHIGAMRNTCSRLTRTLGADSGHDSIGDLPVAGALARMLDRLDSGNQLPRTILYNLNPADNEVFATMIGNFQRGPTPGKLQYGPAWWFLDQRNGIERHLDALGNMGVLGRFIGMTTDSRSLLSYSRHDYFRRILCNVLGMEMEQGLIPRDMPMVGAMVTAICHGNARDYFQFPAKVHAETRP